MEATSRELSRRGAPRRPARRPVSCAPKALGQSPRRRALSRPHFGVTFARRPADWARLPPQVFPRRRLGLEGVLPQQPSPPWDWGLRGAASRSQESPVLKARGARLGAQPVSRPRPQAPGFRATQSGPDLFTRPHRGRKDQPQRRAQKVEGPWEPRVFTAQRRPEAPGPLPCGDKAAAWPSPPHSPSAAGRGSMSPAAPAPRHGPGSCLPHHGHPCSAPSGAH